MGKNKENFLKFKRYLEYKDSGVEWLDSYPIGWIGGQLKRFVIIKITDGPHETPEFVGDIFEILISVREWVCHIQTG